MIRIKKLNKLAKLPSRGSDQAAGLDLYALNSGVILPGHQLLIATGVAIDVGIGMVGLIWPRSKLANKYSIDVMAGVIDSDYRGEVKVILRNNGRYSFNYVTGERIAQLLVQPVDITKVMEVTTLGDTIRGSDGVNSSDMRL